MLLQINPLTVVSDAVTRLAQLIVGALDDDDPKKIEAKAKLLQIQQELERAELDLESELVQAQSKVLAAEAESDFRLTATWRPIAMLTFLAVIVYQSVFVSLFSLNPVDLSGVPPEMWKLLTIGMGGYVFLRSGEKIAATVTEGFIIRNKEPK